MNRRILISLSVLLLAALACSTISVGTNQVVGSGKVISESRNLSGFTSIELAGSADVEVTVGSRESVTVTADDNIVPLIETTVSNGNLVIQTRSNTGITTSNGVKVTIVTKSLKHISVSGSGNMTVSSMTGSELAVDLPGSGDITVTGTTDHLSISMSGSGNIICRGLKAHSATVTLNGSGNITLYADQSLDANIRGSGSISYEGNPAQVTKNVTGSGSITP